MSTMRLELISRHPPTPAQATPLLFVHGAFHGAWCWDEHVLEFFAQHGFAAHALSLRGHGASAGRRRLRWSRLAEYVADVAQVARSLPHPPVVIGHSMGGAVVQHYLGCHAAPAGVLLASVPPAGALPVALRLARRHPLQFAKANLTLSLLPLVATPDLAHEAFFSARMPIEQVLRYARRLQDESYCAFLDLLGLDLPRPQRVTAPLLVLGAAEDTMVGPRDVHATARAYNTQAVIFSDLAHDMMLDCDWQRVAAYMVAWLRDHME